MMTGAAAKDLQLIGALPPTNPAARGIEKLARNPCVRQAVVVVHRVDPAVVMREVLGSDPREGMSPFAQARGNRFEARLLDDGGARLFDLYRRAGRLAPRESALVNTTTLVQGSGEAALRRRAAITEDLLRRKVAGRGGAPNVIVKPVLTVPLAGAQFPIEPDLLVAADDDPMYRVAEIKSYADLGGLTDPTQLRGALRQAAVGLVGLRAALVRLGMRRDDIVACAPKRVDLVLRRRGYGGATLRPMDIDGEMSSLERAFAGLPGLLAEGVAALAVLGPGATLEHPGVIDALPMNYRPDCREFCPLAAHCRDQARAAGEVQTLGARVAAEIAPAGSTMRALELLNGAPPRTAEEAALQAELQASETAWLRARSA